MKAGKTYFWNRRTHETVWRAPADVDVVWVATEDKRGSCTTGTGSPVSVRMTILLFFLMGGGVRGLASPHPILCASAWTFSTSPLNWQSLVLCPGVDQFDNGHMLTRQSTLLRTLFLRVLVVMQRQVRRGRGGRALHRQRWHLHGWFCRSRSHRCPSMCLDKTWTTPLPIPLTTTTIVMVAHEAAGGTSSARWRRERRQRSWWRHEQLSVAAALTPARHHSAGPGVVSRREEQQEEVEQETYDGPRAQKTPPPGERPGVPPELRPQRSDCTVRRSAGDCLPTLALPSLALSAGEAVDSCSSSTNRERPLTHAPLAMQFLDKVDISFVVQRQFPMVQTFSMTSRRGIQANWIFWEMTYNVSGAPLINGFQKNWFFWEMTSSTALRT